MENASLQVTKSSSDKTLACEDRVNKIQLFYFWILVLLNLTRSLTSAAHDFGILCLLVWCRRAILAQARSIFEFWWQLLLIDLDTSSLNLSKHGYFANSFHNLVTPDVRTDLELPVLFFQGCCKLFLEALQSPQGKPQQIWANRTTCVGSSKANDSPWQSCRSCMKLDDWMRLSINGVHPTIRKQHLLVPW